MSMPFRFRKFSRLLSSRRLLVFVLSLVLTSAIFSTGCADEDALDAANAPVTTGEIGTKSGHVESETSASSNSGQASTPHVHAEGETATRNPNERPIPAFEGTTLEGTRLAMRDLIGQRILLFFFNPEVEPARELSRAVATINEQAASNNFKILGIGVGANSTTLAEFAAAEHLEFPILDDSGGSISRKLRLRSPSALIGVDSDGYMDFALGNFPLKGDIVASIEKMLRESLRLTGPPDGSPGSLYAFSNAPALGVVSMSNGEVLETKDLEGRAAIVIFFLHTCPHCHRALASIKSTLESFDAELRPRLVAISIQNAPSAVRKSLRDLDLDYFDPYLDPGGKATQRWGVTGGVPVVLVLDQTGQIRHRSSGWNDRRDPGLVRMKVAKAAGARVPMLLDPKGYSGNDVCGICHEQEQAAWQFTAHSTAFNTLVTHAADRRTDCVGCHVVGFDETGGFDFRHQPAHLEGVGCESCHGRGGPHLTPSFVPRNAAGQHDYQQVCSTCHNPKHSIGFDYAEFHSRISHLEIVSLSDTERADLLGGSGPSRNLLPTSADYVGSNACQNCHQAEFATWESSPHGHAVETLKRAGKAAETECLICHTTAFGKPGGFPAIAKIADHDDLARVGCESCHGPAGDHIDETAKRVGTILSLGDKCDSCVILKICGSCHDEANDSGFQFKVEERIEAQRHGTIDSAASRLERESADRERLRAAFSQLAMTEAR
jgi:peroxiredoxin